MGNDYFNLFRYYIIHTVQLDHAPDGKFDIHSVSFSTYSSADLWLRRARHKLSGNWAPRFVSFP